MLSSGSFTTLHHHERNVSTETENSSTDMREMKSGGPSTHPEWYPKRKEVSVATHTCGSDMRHDGPAPSDGIFAVETNTYRHRQRQK
jgi:hypothetical protein